MEIGVETLKAISLLTVTAYVAFIFKNRRKFNLGMNLIIPITALSTAITLALHVFGKKSLPDGSFLTLGYVGFFFFSLAFGELAGIAAAMGLAAGEYVLSPNPEGTLILLLLSILAGWIVGKTGRAGSEFSTLLPGSIVGGTILVGGKEVYLWALKGIPLQDATEALAPMVVSITTGLLLGTALVVAARKLEKWPGPIEKRG
ncbi:hypothetical protein [Thermococcus waiotapuensis]|uniref:Uncharacterized protein n=1 Tax=Thermococcus waiotapuensis TaxID=90909 RepID=A0AAE4T108_9EURY|nr:hypothetical protein [Thermococcus waiotapuensis]MDV3103775.1 hypothetical protein [Thermococcus waiotapuensis]